MVDASRSRIAHVPANARGTRVDRFLADTFPDLSRSRIQALIAAGHVRQGSLAAKASYKLVGGETLYLDVPPPEPSAVVGEDIAVTIVYEDEDVAVIDKPAGLTVHPSATQKAGTLVNALVGRLSHLSGIGGELRPGIVHRLDKNTSGLIIVAKNDRAHRHLVKAFAERTVDKRYLAYTWGVPPAAGEWQQSIGRHPTDRKRFSTRSQRGKTAHTRFVCLAAYGEVAAKLEVTLLTGRTHQIRVHAADGGFPLIGDRTYGRLTKAKRDHYPALAAFPRQALHAAVLALELPDGRHRRFVSPLPPDLTDLETKILQKIDALG